MAAAIEGPPAPIGPRCEQPTLFDATDVEAWRTHLECEGFVVIGSFLDEPTRRNLLELFWQDFSQCCAVLGAGNQSAAAKTGDQSGAAITAGSRRRRNQPNASRSQIKTAQAPAQAFAKFSPQDRGTWDAIHTGRREEAHAPLHMAQSDFMWELRTHPRMAQVFAHVHRSTPNQMVVSLDSYSLHLRGHPAKTRGHQTGMALALYDDQAQGMDARSEIYSVQGAYNFLSVTEADTGFVVVPGSHKRWTNRRAGRKGSKHRSHFVPLKRDDEDFDMMMSRAVKLIIPENCLVLWSSKTLHGTSPGSRERPPYLDPIHPGAASTGASPPAPVATPIPVPNRLTCFVAMLPRKLRPKEVVGKKEAVYMSGGSTSHWASMGEVHRVNTIGVIGGRLEKGVMPKKRKALL